MKQVPFQRPGSSFYRSRLSCRLKCGTFLTTLLKLSPSQKHSMCYRTLRIREGNMYSLKKIGVSLAAVAFSIGLFTATSNAQYRTRSWTSSRTIYTQPQYRQWQVRTYRTNRISPWQYRRMQRQRYASRYGYYNNNHYYGRRLSWWERRRLAERYNRYNNRTQYRVRNW